MKPRSETNRVILHHSLSNFGDVDIIGIWHDERGFEGIGYHFVVPLKGRFQHGRNIRMIGAHALGKNSDSIGVCIVGDFNLYEPNGHQINECARLYHDLCRAYNKTLTIEYHHELCPGFMLDRVAFKKNITGDAMKGLPYTVAEMWKLAELCRYNNHDSGDGDNDLTDFISDHVEARYPDSIFLEMQNIIEYMYILDKPDKLVFTFRGTDGMKAWLNNFKIIPNQLGAHSGFYDLFSYFALEIARYIKNKYDGKKPVYCTGHSLGGAMAQFTYWYLQTRFNITSTCINFGAPVCGNAEFAAEINKCSGLNLRIVNNWDLVTRLDFGIGKYAGSEMQIGTKPFYRRLFPFTLLDHHYYFYTKSLMRYYKMYGVDKMLKPVLERCKWL